MREPCALPNRESRRDKSAAHRNVRDVRCPQVIESIDDDVAEQIRKDLAGTLMKWPRLVQFEVAAEGRSAFVSACLPTRAAPHRSDGRERRPID